jgi:hypothetical protein
MKIVNLDKFAEKQKFILEGKEYEIRGMTVNEYISDNWMEKIDEQATEKERVETIIKTICKLSDVPEEVLWRQPFEVLTILLQLSQGVNPDEEDKKK